VLIGGVGADIFGKELIKNLRDNGIDTKYIIEDSETYTGLALIMVDKNGDNILAVASGADLRIREEDIDKVEEVIRSSDILLIQLEIPLHIVEYAINMAFNEGVKVLLNPAPAKQLSKDLLKKVYVLIPNEKEAELLSNVKIKDLHSSQMSAKKLLESGIENVVLTLGKNGSIIGTKEETIHITGLNVNAIDTTGAGDAFCGALAVALSSGKKLKDAVIYANYVGALATTKIGAQEALPTKEELEDFIKVL
ncbi:bifunctional hydroxymethylpyrimidine kinase/phosphomethylpyrimidine kinase, partial [Candidatus Bathyarchaeota archaeon]|nr:bifunctional hydroxymethylpyrimidine kinase/phosphomethylpyrimidine kinase [Candidatus Bathyarchaeota archaeon]